MPKFTYETLTSSQEYLLWKDLFRVSEEYKITVEEFFNKEDLGGLYWEPFLDRLFKLGVMLKVTKKLKEIKMDWIRPILYFGTRSDGIIEFDGRHDKVDKGAIADATEVRFGFKNVINAVREIETLDETNFKEKYKILRSELKSFFAKLSKYVRDSFRLMNNHIKLILKPLLDLRRSGYRLFALECEELNYRDLTIFKDKNDLSLFKSGIKNFFKWEAFKLTRDIKNDEHKNLLTEFMEKDIVQSHYFYNFNNTIRETPKNNNNLFLTINNFHNTKRSENKSVRLPSLRSRHKPSMNEEERKLLEERKRRILIFPNLENLKQKNPTKLKHDAYQLQFEEGLSSIYNYLYEKQPKEFPFEINTHKIFVNINFIPNGKSLESTNYYINQLVNTIESIKQKCYEMKLNGLSRVLMPITKNIEIIKLLKTVYDLHSIIDRVMGNFLLYDQYIFIYDSIKFILNSSVSEQIEKFKNRDFMEDAIPKYIFFQSMCHSVKVLEKMRNFYKEEIGRPFKFEDSYQITKHELDKGDNEVLYAYEIYGIYKKFYTEDLKNKKNLIDNEIKKFGRFWLMEGFFNKNDKNLWIEAIDLLSSINELVRDDIRDNFLYSKKEEININLNSSQNSIDLNSSVVSKTSKTNVRKKSNKLLAVVKKSSKGLKNNEKIRNNSIRISKRKSSRLKTSSESEIKRLPEDLNVFRPPKVWNFPFHRLIKLKFEKFLNEGGNIKTEIRDVDPTLCYKDNRVQKFKELFFKIYSNSKEYLKNEKGDLWDLYFTKILKVMGISYTSFKMMKEEEEREKQNQEEMEKKRKEEEEKEAKDKEELEELGLNMNFDNYLSMEAEVERNDDRKNTRKTTRRKTRK